LVAALSKAEVLTDDAIVGALTDLGVAFTDEDFGAALLGELSLALVAAGQLERAESVAHLIRDQEKSEQLRSLAAAQIAIGQQERVRAILEAARQAAFIYRFPTQQGQSLAGGNDGEDRQRSRRSTLEVHGFGCSAGSKWRWN
jgi:hypothetical protein